MTILIHTFNLFTYIIFIHLFPNLTRQRPCVFIIVTVTTRMLMGMIAICVVYCYADQVKLGIYIESEVLIVKRTNCKTAYHTATHLM